jgi:dolichol-phosphate mannosyltransferase
VACQATCRALMSLEPVRKFALVIPTLNEAENIQPLVERIQAALDPAEIPYEIVIVDDSSVDGTSEVVSALAESDPRIRLLVRRNQRGLAGAVIHGWNHTDAELLGAIDADLQHPPELLPALIEAVSRGHDIAIGSRYANGNSIQGWNPLRLVVSRLSTLATLPFQKRNLRIKDPMSGFFVLRRACIEGLELQPQGFKILLEILVRGRIRSAAEIPYQFGIRHAGKSKADVKVALHYFSLLGKLSRELIFRPGHQ